MKILVVSDRVREDLCDRSSSPLPSSPELILSCGDLPPEYLSRLREFYQVPLYFIQGNHDLRYLTSPPVGCIDIHGNVICEDGVNIMGISGSRWYNGGINQFSEPEMKKIIRGLWFKLLLKRPLDIVVTHAPPRGVHDREDPCHKGFRGFQQIIEKEKPCWFLHGHIHERFDNPQDRITMVNNTLVINCYEYFFFDTQTVL